MKRILLILLFSFFTSVTFAQDTIIKLNNDTIISKTKNAQNNITTVKNYGSPIYIFHNGGISEQNIQYILLQTNDKEITYLIHKAQIARRREFVGFLAIPFGIASVCSYWSLVMNNEALGSRQTSSAVTKQYLKDGKILGTLFTTSFVLTINCPIISILSKHEKIKHNSDAIKLYNQKF